MSNNLAPRKATYSTSTVFIVLGVLALFFIIVYLYNYYKELQAKMLATNATKPFAMCPDYWDSIGKSRCQNTNALGSCSKVEGANIMDFSGEVFNNINTGNYSKCKWAKACNVSWSNVDRMC